MLIALLAAPVLALFHAFVVHTMWSWFVVPLGAPQVGYAHAYGLALLVSLATYQAGVGRDVDPLEMSVTTVVHGLLVLAFAWVAFQLTGF